MRNFQIEETDFVLVEQLKQGNSPAFNMLYTRHFRKLYGFSLRMTGNRQDAEEVVQEVFTKIWEMRDRLEPNLSFSSLLFTIGKNNIYNKARKRLYDRAYQEYLARYAAKSQAVTEDDILLHEMEIFLEKAIDLLPERRREIFIMSRKNGLTNKEIAQKLNTSLSNVENHINKALQSLRRRLTGKELLVYLAWIYMLE